MKRARRVKPFFIRVARLFLGCGGIITLLIAAGCSTPRYFYVPVQNQVDVSGRRNEAFYSVPSQNPKGSVRVVFVETTDTQASASSKEVRSIYLRMVISNQTRKPWKVHSKNQYLLFPNKKPIHSLNQETTVVQPKELKKIDLFFPLPLTEDSPSDISEFDFHWEIETDSGLIEETTPFDRVRPSDGTMIVYPPLPYPYYPTLYPYTGWYR